MIGLAAGARWVEDDKRTRQAETRQAIRSAIAFLLLVGAYCAGWALLGTSC